MAKSDPEKRSAGIQLCQGPGQPVGAGHCEILERDLEAPSSWRAGSAVSRLTALVIVKDSILLGHPWDGNFLPGWKRKKVYRNADKLDVPRSDVDRVEQWLDAFRALRRDWDDLATE